MTSAARVSELEIQQAFARFLTDPVARGAVLGDNSSSTDSWCAPNTRERLRALDQERTAMFSSILVGNRLSKIMEGLPWTSWALGARLVSVVAEYNQNCPPCHPKKYDEAMGFAAFLESMLRVKTIAPPWLYDVLRYERTILRLRFAQDPGQAGPICADFLLRNSKNVRPRLLASVEVISLDYNIEEIGSAFERNEGAPDLSPQPIMLLLQGMVNGSVRQDEINWMTAEFLGTCVEDRSLAEVIVLVANRLGLPRDDIQEGCIALCAELGRRGVLRLS